MSGELEALEDAIRGLNEGVDVARSARAADAAVEGLTDAERVAAETSALSKATGIGTKEAGEFLQKGAKYAKWTFGLVSGLVFTVYFIKAKGDPFEAFRKMFGDMFPWLSKVIEFVVIVFVIILALRMYNAMNRK